MTDLELIAIFAGSWIVAAAVWMLLDWAARPKHARFHAKGDRVQRGPLEYRHFRKLRRAEEAEETRLRLTERTGKPTLAMRSKRRDAVLARHDRPEPVATQESKSDEEFWIDLRDSSFDDANAERLAAGTPPIRFNPIKGEDEIMIRTEADTAVWPDSPVDPFAGQELTTMGAAADTEASLADSTSAASTSSDSTSSDSTSSDSTDDADDADLDDNNIDDLDNEESPGGEQVTERVVRDLKSLPEAG